MKAFWILLSVFVIAGAAIVIRNSNASATPPEAMQDVASKPSPAASTNPAPTAPAPATKRVPIPSTPTATPSSPAADLPSSSSSSSSSSSQSKPVLAPADAAATAKLAAPTTATPANLPSVTEKSTTVADAPSSTTPKTSTNTTPPAPSSPDSSSPITADSFTATGQNGPLGSYEEFEKQLRQQDSESKKLAAQKPAEQSPSPADLGVKIEERADGTKLVDGRFTLKGEGTKEKPYVVAWEQFVAVQESYAPKEGKKEIPPSIKMLDGKWVRITGYVAFPLMVQEADELLSMMNQWDGCCIGTPPTPYDAVEVRLTSPVSGKVRMTTYGTVTGLFKVDPHLVGGWLVGLYVMDRAILTPEGYGGFSP